MSLYITHVDKVEKKPVDFKGAKDAYIQWLIDPSAGAKNFAMRMFTIKPGGEIPKHSHWYEHEIFVLKGKGVIGAGDKEYEVSEGNVIYVPSNIPHWYRNTGSEDWVFICVIPLRKPTGAQIKPQHKC
ncbi:MAG: cupin domain-containing protein [Thermoprotei archaeon]|nr:MAG: cupin domain-containing protein [Thermoprotei archaeon]